MNKKPFVICLMGTTASKKTKLAIKLTNYLPVDIISVDSASIYKYLNIGTDKPSYKELSEIPHKLINIKEPYESYSVINFFHDALEEINLSINNNRIPLLVGGSMLYYKVLMEGISNILPKKNIIFRKNIHSYSKKLGFKNLHNHLKIIDPISAKRINKNDIFRIIRSLEVFYITKKKMSEIFKKKNKIKKIPYNFLKFAIVPNSKFLLHRNIEKRFKKMLSMGFQEEVEKIINCNNVKYNMQSMNCIGYRQMWQYIDGKISYNTMIEKSVNLTKNLAKKQLTWLKKWKNIYYLKKESIIKNIELLLNCVNIYKNIYI
ncbi:tRNA (adenosine(37)-N6)-dimethylallyltransferase MiaA [Buchnera aphidicola (Taiwanaphis decaspermi)]|uniref:tRNA (adenosine(37)-N6)-dimethylallyltransferase MiaA n=1 Tax=Buchnera aphidicola TaxID=9 RepID=UPI0031B88424